MDDATYGQEVGLGICIPQAELLDRGARFGARFTLTDRMPCWGRLVAQPSVEAVL